MSHEISKKLNSSLDALEQSIRGTRVALLSKPSVPPRVFEHIDNYLEILSKQRKLAEELEVDLANKQFEKVARGVRIINGLSTMIKEDAQLLLDGPPKFSLEGTGPETYS